MIFSTTKWDDAAELQQYISVANSLHFKSVEAALKNAFEMFIRPLLGEELTNELIGYYTTQTTPADAKQMKLLELAQRANAYLAFWYDYNEMQVLIGNSGTVRQESAESKTPYKYQEQALRKGWKDKGFAALDNMLTYLEDEISSFGAFKSSANYTTSKTAIVRNTGDVSEYYWISNSRIIFLRLRPHFKTVIDTILAPRMGAAIYDELMLELAKELPAEKYVKLRKAMIPVVVFYAVARLIRQTGDLTDRGLFFETMQSSQDMATTTPVNNELIAAQATRAEADAIQYWSILEKLLKNSFSYQSSSSSMIPNRNNNDKKSFWA